MTPAKKAPPKRTRRTTPKKAGPLRVDLGCGQRIEEGWTGVDLHPPAAVIHDLGIYPWPFEDRSVDEARAFHLFEHIAGPDRIPFMDELWRILKPGAQAQFITPHAWSDRAIQDPTHKWPPLAPTSYLYFNKAWREQNGLDHYLGSCDFDFSYGYSINAEFQTRADDMRTFALAHYIHAADDLIVTLTRR